MAATGFDGSIQAGYEGSLIGSPGIRVDKVSGAPDARAGLLVTSVISPGGYNATAGKDPFAELLSDSRAQVLYKVWDMLWRP